jgi:Raf kinase inhibitor-like YbhB/YbcL family protein
LAARGGWRELVLARRIPLAVLASGLASVLASGCGVLGSPMRARLGSATSITVTSPVVGADTILPASYTCYGAGLSPPLYWSGVPEPQTKSLALVVDDSRAPITPYIYWLVYNISPGTTSIPQGGIPVGATQGPNSTGKMGYLPPCPTGAHGMYRFTVYALDARLDLTGDGLRDTWSTIARHVIASGRLVVRSASGNGE